ncbi:MAG: hypothetical protein P4M05_17525 [Bradyrhizobium sp.]|nr:hypothetical protein [Bradyrhizobium sp.]
MAPIEFREKKTREIQELLEKISSLDGTSFDRLLDAGREAAAVAPNQTRQAIYVRLQRLYRKGAREAKLVEIGLKAKK